MTKMSKTKIKLTRQTITLALEDNKTHKVSAWVYNDLLAWHKSITGQWVLTHLSTGYKVVDFNGSYKDIRLVTQEVANLNWGTSCHNKLIDLSNLIKPIINKWGES